MTAPNPKAGGRNSTAYQCLQVRHSKLSVLIVVLVLF